jgi:hypothetical protein
MTIGITAMSMIAWSAHSPSSPASSTRRGAALGLDRSVRPSKVVDRAVDAQFSIRGNSKSTFTEISYTELLILPAELAEAAVEETLTYYDFPEEHWRRIRTTDVFDKPLLTSRRMTAFSFGGLPAAPP